MMNRYIWPGLAACMLFAGTAHANCGAANGWTCIAHTSTFGTGGANGIITTPAINCTGADLEILATANYYGGANLAKDSNFTDSTGANTWLSVGAEGDGTSQWWVTLNYVQAPTVSASQTFTTSISQTGSSYSFLVAACYSGSHASPLDQTNTNNGSGGTTQTTGNVSPSQNCELLVAMMGVGSNAATPMSVNDSFTILENQSNGSANNAGGAYADLIQTAKAAENPTFTWTNATSDGAAAVIGTFKAASTGCSAATATPTRTLTGAGQ